MAAAAGEQAPAGARQGLIKGEDPDHMSSTPWSEIGAALARRATVATVIEDWNL